MRNLKQIFGLFYGPSHVIAMITITFCNYEALMVDGVLALGLGFIALSWAAMLLLWLDLIAEVNRRSELLLVHVKQACSGKLFLRRDLRREIVSMRALRIEMGHLFFYDKAVILTTLGLIVQNTINLVLA